MNPFHSESPVNPLPAVIWVLAAALALPELAFLLGGSLGGNSAEAMRINAIQLTAWIPDLALHGPLSALHFEQFYRLLAYSFVSASGMGTLFVLAFTLALGKAVGSVFSQWAVAAIFIGSALGGALVYTLFAALPGQPRLALIGGYPAAYGMIGAFTWLLWMRLRAGGDNPARAFLLIGTLILFQLAFAILYRSLPSDLVAEFAGFATGFFLSFLVAPGGWKRLRHR